jgi:two-component system response regulator AtoC
MTTRPTQTGGTLHDETRKQVARPVLPPLEVIFGSTPAMAVMHEQIKKFAASQLPVLLTGESGTGKGLIAALIHQYSPGSPRALVQVNCAALPATLMESELFGHERGSFTGASSRKCGRVELADSGTLFLDEIAELDPHLQAKLLHLLQDGQFSRIGAQEDRKVSVRFIFATGRDLDQEILRGNFREDLFYRMDGVTLRLPPLRERVEDIPILVEYFLRKYNEKYNCRAIAVSDSTMESLQAYNWPGNIRQLENAIRRYVVLRSEQALLADVKERKNEVFQFVIPPNGKISLREITREAVRQVERQVILKVLEANGGRRKRSAKMLKISYRALVYKLQELRVPSQYKSTLAIDSL